MDGLSTGVEIQLIDELEAWVEQVYVDDPLERRRLEAALGRRALGCAARNEVLFVRRESS